MQLESLIDPKLWRADEKGCEDMLGIAEYKAFSDATLPQAFIYLRGDINECSSGRYLEP